MSEGSSIPKNWKEAAPYIAWGALVFTCFFVFIEKLVEENYGQALAALLLGLGIAAVALHSKTWLEQTNPNWAFAAFGLLLAGIILAPFVEQRRWPFLWQISHPIKTAPPIVIHDAPTPEDIAKATASIQSRLDETVRERDVAIEELARLKAHQQEAQTTLPNLGPMKTLTIEKYIQKIPDHWAVFITYTPENFQFRTLLQALLGDRAWILDAPDNSTDLDAPKFPSPPSAPGFTFHGNNTLNEQLGQLLGPCFIVRRTDRLPNGLSDWFNKRLDEPERNENRKITWIEIGHGSPWQTRGAITDCVQ